MAEARQAGARAREMSLEPSEVWPLFDEAVAGPATETVVAGVAGLLAEARPAGSQGAPGEAINWT